MNSNLSVHIQSGELLPWRIKWCSQNIPFALSPSQLAKSSKPIYINEMMAEIFLLLNLISCKSLEPLETMCNTSCFEISQVQLLLDTYSLSGLLILGPCTDAWMITRLPAVMLPFWFYFESRQAKVFVLFLLAWDFCLNYLFIAYLYRHHHGRFAYTFFSCQIMFGHWKPFFTSVLLCFRTRSQDALYIL